MTTWPALNLWADLQATKDSPIGQPADPRTSGGWTNIGAYVESASITRGMSRYDGPVIRYAPGTFSAQLRNDDARFDPFDSSVYPDGAIEPLRGLAMQASWSGTHYKLWRGATDVWTPTYPLAGNAGVVKLDGIDGLTQMARWDENNPSGISGGGPGTSTGAWVNDTLAAPGGVRMTLGYTTSDGIITSGHSGWTGNALAEAYKAVDTELGELYLDGNAAAVMRFRNAILTESRSNTSQATFEPGTGLPFADLVVAYDDHGVRNTVTASYAGGVEQLVDNATSRGKYGLRFYSNTALVHTTDNESLDWAGMVAYLAGLADPRVEQLVIDPQAAPSTLFPQVLSRELGDRITVEYTPPGGSALVRDAIIRGITHAIGRNSWRTTWTLEDATKYDAFLIWDADDWDAKLWA